MKTEIRNLEESTNFKLWNGYYRMVSELAPELYGCFCLNEDGTDDEYQDYLEIDGETIVEVVNL